MKSVDELRRKVKRLVAEGIKQNRKIARKFNVREVKKGKRK